MERDVRTDKFRNIASVLKFVGIANVLLNKCLHLGEGGLRHNELGDIVESMYMKLLMRSTPYFESNGSGLKSRCAYLQSTHS